MLFTPTSESKERVLKTGAQALFFVSSSAILNSYGDYRCKPVSRPTFPVPRFSFSVPRFSFSVPRFSFSVPRPPSPVPRSPFFVLRSSFCVLRSPFFVLRFPFSALRSPFPAPRSPLPVLRSPILILVQNLPCLKCVFSSVLNSRSSLQNLCFYLRSVLRVLHEYKIQINAQCKAFKAPLNIFTSA